MSQNIASKLAAVAIAVVLNGILLGGVFYLLDSKADAAPASAQCQSSAIRVVYAIV